MISSPTESGFDFDAFIDQATWVTVNDYEAQLLQERTGLSAAQIATRVSAFIVTRGAEGSVVYLPDGRQVDIPPVRPAQVVDPTGCGDAYRAGLLYGIANDFDWATAGRLASLLGSIKIASPGTQNHRFTADEFADRFETVFGYRY